MPSTLNAPSTLAAEETAVSFRKIVIVAGTYPLPSDSVADTPPSLENPLDISESPGRGTLLLVGRCICRRCGGTAAFNQVCVTNRCEETHLDFGISGFTFLSSAEENGEVPGDGVDPAEDENARFLGRHLARCVDEGAGR